MKTLFLYRQHCLFWLTGRRFKVIEGDGEEKKKRQSHNKPKVHKATLIDIKFRNVHQFAPEG